MKVNSIYINLPIQNLDITRSFWTALGFSFNEQFSDDKALCLILNEEKGIYAMLITHAFYSTFTNRPIADGTTTQVLVAIELNSKTEVNQAISKAMENGATRYREPVDHGWMYYDTFADLDGHQWEVMYMDPSLLPKE
jgi:predicted lactoylglutathione lyase